MEHFRFYRLDADRSIDQASQVDAQYRGVIWRPRGVLPIAPDAPVFRFGVWWAFHHGRVFYNRDYAVFLIRSGAELAHRSCIFPGYFRFPFMSKSDLQIGDTLTSENHRRQGLARFALQEIVREFRAPGRRFWYAVSEDNVASVRVVEKAGFSLVGEGVRTKPLGIRLLGRFELCERVMSEVAELGN